MRVLVCAAAALAPWPAFALDAPPEDKTIPEIVVTGEFRDTQLDELPASVSVLDGRQIAARDARHLEDILALAPNVNLAGGSARSRFFQIRGIGERGQFIEPLNPSVGLLIDGVDLSDSAAAATLFDVDQVEVFHGPQGTRYGANALAGLINVRTRQPGDTFEADAGLEGANYGTWTLNGAISGPLSERVSARLAAQQHRSDGFLHNAFLDRDDTNKRDERSFRGKLRWSPHDDATVEVMLGYVDLDDGYDAFSLDNTRTTLSDQPGRDAQKTAFGSVRLDWSGHSAFTVQATAAAASSDSIYSYDEDWTYTGFHPDGYSSFDAYFRDRRNVSGELKLLSQEAGRLFGGATDWVIGIYGLNRDEDLRREYTFLAGPFTSTFGVRRLAAFSELKTELGGRTDLTTGLRYERHKASYRDSEAVAFSPVDDMFGWRVSLDRSLRRGLMAYASISRGYKAGGFNTDGTLDPDLRQYDPETLTNYELGVKGRFLDGRVDARITAFYMRRNDVQIATSQTRVRSDGSTEFIEFTGNAAEGINAGLEAELAIRATDSLEIMASLGLLRSRYKSFVNSNGEDLDGREQAHAPGYQFAARARYAFSPAWYAELGAEGRDAFYFSDSESILSRPYEIFNATLGFARRDWEVQLWVRNLANEDYFVRGYYFANDPRLYSVDPDHAARSYTQLGAPRQYGITATWTFH